MLDKHEKGWPEGADEEMLNWQNDNFIDFSNIFVYHLSKIYTNTLNYWQQKKKKRKRASQKIKDRAMGKHCVYVMWQAGALI